MLQKHLDILESYLITLTVFDEYHDAYAYYTSTLVANHKWKSKGMYKIGIRRSEIEVEYTQLLSAKCRKCQSSNYIIPL